MGEGRRKSGERQAWFTSVRRNWLRLDGKIVSSQPGGNSGAVTGLLGGWMTDTNNLRRVRSIR